MNTSDQLVAYIRSADPLGEADLDGWPDEATTHRVIDRIVASDPYDSVVDPAAEPVAGRARPRRVLTPLAGVLVLAVAGTGIAFATGILGGPAPDPVKAHLAELDRGIPADLRYNADVEGARAVAAADGGALYYAVLADGGYCLEVTSDGTTPRGASCVPAARLGSLPLDVIAPIAGQGSGPLFVAGRANDRHVSRLQARFSDGTTIAIPFGLDRSWLLAVPEPQRASALADGLSVLALDDSGATVTTVSVPPLRDDDPTGTAHDGELPLVLTTTSDGSDFTLVLGIAGRVNVPGAVNLELRFPDGTHLAVPTSNGRFDLVLPGNRQHDFARAAGTLVALQDGVVVATARVGSVAYWRAHG